MRAEMPGPARLGEKLPYQPELTFAKLYEHTQHFCNLVRGLLTQFRRGGDQPLPNLGREIVVSDVGIDERPPLMTAGLSRPVSRTAAR